MRTTGTSAQPNSAHPAAQPNSAHPAEPIVHSVTMLAQTMSRADSERWSASASSEHWSPSAAAASDDERWSASSAPDEEEPLGEEAAGELIKFLLTRHVEGTISARTMCVICWWAVKAGCRSEKVSKFAYSPEAQTGKYQRHVDAAMGVSTKNQSSYRVDVPSYLKHGLTRQEVPTTVGIPHEQLLEEIADNVTFEDDLHSAVQERRLPPSYYSHDVVLAADGAGDPHPPVPIGMFIDGVQFLKKASFIAVWVFSLVTGQRHILAILKKHQLCSCGCRGWCSLYRVFDFARWALTAAADGVFPLRRHNDVPWPEGDPRGDVAGTPMPFKFALVWLKADWGEFAGSIGFQTWSSNLWPCYCCHAERDSMRVVLPEYATSLPWAPVSQQDYDEACAACQLDVTVPDRETHAAIRAALFFDRRKRGARGRALLADVQCGDVLLKAGDRLEVSPLLDSTFAFDAIRTFPREVRFWRRSCETLAHRQNPLFYIPGFTVERLVVDTLHCLYLGVVQAWQMASLWAMLNRDVWGTGDVNLSVMRLRAELHVYYKARRGKVTVVQNITAKMLGTPTKTAAAPFKGAEAKGLIDFVVQLLEKHSPGFEDLLAAGRHLQRYVEFIDNNPANLTAAVAGDMRESAVGFLFHGLRGGMRPIAKVHQLLHLVHEVTSMHGNPRFYSNWIDESLNRDLAGIAKAAYSSVWADRIFICWRFLRDSLPCGLTLAS